MKRLKSTSYDPLPSTSEQLVPILSPHCIIYHVWVVCHPYPKNKTESNREIYESAHSVVLSMLVCDFQSGQETSTSLDLKKRSFWMGFTYRLVPFYAQRLVENTMLTIPHAYSSLVQCAGARTVTNTSANVAGSAAALRYCIQLILDPIDALSSPPSSESLLGPHSHLFQSEKLDNPRSSTSCNACHLIEGTVADLAVSLACLNDLSIGMLKGFNGAKKKLQ